MFITLLGASLGMIATATASDQPTDNTQRTPATVECRVFHHPNPNGKLIMLPPVRKCYTTAPAELASAERSTEREKTARD